MAANSRTSHNYCSIGYRSSAALPLPRAVVGTTVRLAVMDSAVRQALTVALEAVTEESTKQRPLLKPPGNSVLQAMSLTTRKMII